MRGIRNSVVKLPSRRFLKEFAKDTDRLSRFEREVKAVSSLNHPHIFTFQGVCEVRPRLAALQYRMPFEATGSMAQKHPDEKHCELSFNASRYSGVTDHV